MILILGGCGGGGTEREGIEELLRGYAAARSTEEHTEFQRRIDAIGIRAVPELMRISSDTSLETPIRHAAILRLYSEPRALPVLVALLDDPSSEIRSACAGALDWCLKIGHPSDATPESAAARYRTWWSEHRLDYLDAWRVHPAGDSAPREGVAVGEVREILEDLIRGGHFAKHDERITRLKWTRGAIPELIRIAQDTSYPNRHWALLVLGMMEDSSVEPFLLDTLRATKDARIRRACVQGLNQLHGLGFYNAGDPDEEEIVGRYLGRR